WYYQLAERHSDVVDVFIAISTRIRDRLHQVIPNRADSIVLQPFGVRIPDHARAAAPGRLRVAYVGRLKEDKGIYDLPLIDRAPAGATAPTSSGTATSRRPACSRCFAATTSW